MSEMDDIFDIEDFFKRKRAPKKILVAWKTFWKNYNAMESAVDDLRRLKGALAVLRNELFHER